MQFYPKTHQTAVISALTPVLRSALTYRITDTLIHSIPNFKKIKTVKY